MAKIFVDTSNKELIIDKSNGVWVSCSLFYMAPFNEFDWIDDILFHIFEQKIMLLLHPFPFGILQDVKPNLDQDVHFLVSLLSLMSVKSSPRSSIFMNVDFEANVLIPLHILFTF